MDRLTTRTNWLRAHLLSAPLALVLLVALTFAALAQSTLKFPDLTGRVVDQAGILDAVARNRLDMKLAAHEQKTSDQLVIATVPSLQGTAVEDFANQLFRLWKLGQAKTNNGVLILVAPNDRKIRIEVGYGLEGTLTDAVSKMIIQAAIAPKFKAGDFAGGLEAGVDAIVSTLQGDGEWQDRVKLRNQPSPEGYDPLALFLLVIIIIIVINIMAARSRPGPPGASPHRRRGGNWVIVPPSNGGFGGGFGGGGFGGGGGGFSGGGGSSGGGGASGDW